MLLHNLQNPQLLKPQKRTSKSSKGMGWRKTYMLLCSKTKLTSCPSLLHRGQKQQHLSIDHLRRDPTLHLLFGGSEMTLLYNQEIEERENRNNQLQEEANQPPSPDRGTAQGDWRRTSRLHWTCPIYQTPRTRNSRSFHYSSRTQNRQNIL